MTTTDAFLLFFRGLARHAPGSEEATLRALAACDLPAAPVVYDLGAGTGASTLVLAEALDVPILAVDRLPESLREVRRRAKNRGFADLVKILEADFLDLDLPPADLLWSEGAIYSVGWSAALDAWLPLLAADGHLVVTDAVWNTSDPPVEVTDFWAEAYPEMTTASDLAALAESRGLEVVESFPLAAETWDDYYGPLRQRVALVLDESSDEDLRSVADRVAQEVAVHDVDPDAVTYTFFILRRAH